MPDLYEYAVKKDVVIATPTTLIGMLRAISYGWKQAALADKAAEVFKLGRELHERLGQMGAKFEKLGRALGVDRQRLQRDRRHGREPGAGHGAAVPRPPGQRDRARARPAPATATGAARRRPRSSARRPVPGVAELVEADARGALERRGPRPGGSRVFESVAFGDAGSYARFMGRFSEPLAPLFADLVGAAGRRAGCSTSGAGPGS